MAWNQPGGQNNPWGRRPGQGSSNLDDKVKDWQRRLESLLRSGGGGGGGGADGGRDDGGSMLLLVAGIILAVWLASGFYQVNAAERGVVQRFGRFVEARGPGWGWRWPWPIETVTKVNVANVNSSEYKSRVLTADVNLVDLRFAVQYRFADPTKVLFRVRDPEATLREVSESAIRETVGRAQLDEVLVGASRPMLTRRTMDLIQRTLDAYDTGISVTTVNLTDVQVPEPVIPSQRDANKALADQERLVKEAQAYANGILPVAQGTAARTMQDAEAYRAQVVAIAEGQASRFSQLADAYAKAPDVMRQRLYIETVETVMSRARKVVIDSKGGSGSGGNILYLPLDKLMERSGQPEAPAETTIRSSVGDAEATGQDSRTRGER
jgi:membrane protease subunit HflK